MRECVDNYTMKGCIERMNVRERTCNAGTNSCISG